MSMAAAQQCVNDEFRYGTWTHETNKDLGSPRRRASYDASDSRCGRWEYRNKSCGPDFSIERLCAVLNCRSVLSVGDSLARNAFAGLEMYSQKAYPRWQSLACPRADHFHGSFTICANMSTATNVSCPEGLQVSYIRADHLLGAVAMQPPGGPIPGQANGNCEKQWMPVARHNSKLGRAYQILILTKGAHLQAYKLIEGSDHRENSSWIADRAEDLVRLLQPRREGIDQLEVIYVKPHWGFTNYTTNPGSPLGSAQLMHCNRGGLDEEHSWCRMPLFNQVTGDILKRGLGALVIDTTEALGLRPDCRSDYLHVRVELLLHSTWRMLQNSLAARAGYSFEWLRANELCGARV